MTSPYLLGDLRRDEGLRLVAYPDPLTHAAPWTIGYGHTGPDVHAGLEWSTAQADDALAADVAAAVKGLDAAAPWWRGLDDARQDCLANMAFNMGVARLMAFTTFLGLVKAHDFAAAAADAVHTLWAGQVGARAQRIAAQMRTGLHQA
jgi:lysozyme